MQGPDNPPKAYDEMPAINMKQPMAWKVETGDADRVLAIADGNEKTALADIMAEEEAERAVKEVEEDDERILREVMEASLREVSAEKDGDQAMGEDMRLALALSLHGSGAEVSGSSKHSAVGTSPRRPQDAKSVPSSEAGSAMGEDMSLALALSLQEPGGGAGTGTCTEFNLSMPMAAASAAAAVDVVSAAEADLIAKAIQEADDAETAASLRLALQLQEEEREGAIKSQESIQKSRQMSGHVTTVTEEEFFHQQHPDERGERKLLGANDYECLSDNDYEEDNDCHQHYPDRSHAGFRMNSSTQSKSWSRLDRNIIIGPNQELRTKHDVELKNRSNAERLLGAGYRGELGISDRAFNSFRQSTKKRSVVKGVAAHGHGRAENYDGGKTRGGAMDGNVRLLVTRAINIGLIGGCNGVVKEGKEAIVYHASCGDGTVDDDGNIVGGSDGKDVAVKMFKRIQEFRGRRSYIDGDSRYHKTNFKNIDPRKQVELWAEKEFRNLMRANKAGVPVPTPLLQRENVLFMRFLGEEGWPSPQLREVEIKKGSSKWTAIYLQTMVAVRRLYHCARLVHGDLSEYNILLCPSYFIENSGNCERKDEPNVEGLEIVLIDFGQAVEHQHPSAKSLLERDLSMVRRFFVKQSISVLSDTDAMKFILDPCQNERGEDELKDSEDDEEEEEKEEEKGCMCQNEEDEKAWRYTIPGWDDVANFERIESMMPKSNVQK